ncbi:helix-turn-helix domain-containing protein (plasmid) [Rhizobium sp. CB3060]|uniref:helix-turn-helix transcriptional regulator n=1 Tax=Rhizobium sp. CB3060 TaxID=3138255 RepID=UPI0021A503E5|nr:helix-turn-helix transcriptional regulator [Rhizobium tropici]UWU26061.1 helix-turn-helix domain-containing protein [Rhizobium tropici]
MQLVDIAAAGCGQPELCGRSGLNQAVIKPRGCKHEISIEGNKFLIGRTGVAGGGCILDTKVFFGRASEIFILCLPAFNDAEAAADEERVSTRRNKAFFSSNLDLVKERLAHEQANCIMLAFEAGTLERQLSASVGESALDGFKFDGMIDLATASGSHLAALAEFIWNCLDAPEGHGPRGEAIKSLFQAVIIALFHSITASHFRRKSRPTSPAMPWHVKRAIAFMRANLASHIAVAVIAREVGTSVRALQVAFKRFRRTTPISYLQTIRLEVARDALLNNTSSSSISDVARNAGFAHMGRFAAAYRKAYGETPSATVLAQKSIPAVAGRDTGSESTHQ